MSYLPSLSTNVGSYILTVAEAIGTYAFNDEKIDRLHRIDPSEARELEAKILAASIIPTALNAGLTALSILGTGGMGCAAFAAFAGGSLLSAYGSYITDKHNFNKVHNGASALLAASSILNMAAGIYLIISQPFRAVPFGINFVSVALSGIVSALVLQEMTE